MKRLFFTLTVFAFLANVSAQVKVNSSGQVGIKTTNPQYELDVVGNTRVAGNIYLGSSSDFLGTTANNVPITFKLNNVLAGYTGHSGSSNVSFGYQALNNSCTDQSFSVAIGVGALYYNMSGFANTANGGEALYSNNSGYQNTANGYRALYSNISGYANTAIGQSSLYNNEIGHHNTATGNETLYNNTWGSNNTAYGSWALPSNTLGENNTACGSGAVADNTTGSYNTGIGSWALRYNTTGSYNIAIGCETNFTAGNLTNAIAIGYNATVNASDQVRLGNYTVTSVGGAVTWSTVSDGRTKRNIRTEVPGLAFINRLQPVMYNFDLDAMDELLKSDDPKINHFRDSLRMARSPEEKAIEAKSRAKKEKQVYSGFIAQDVEKAARAIGYDFSGIDMPENGKGAYGLRYAEFVVPLVKAVQELSEQNARLQEQINELKGNSALRSSNSETETIGTVDPVVAQCKLYQNAPNPFTQNTQIRYSIPDDIQTALLCIYNLQGGQIKQILLSERGEGSQWISGSELSAGMYLYALIVDGKEVDVKRMILTK